MSVAINAASFLMLSVFGIAAVGYLLGRITIKEISLGIRDRGDQLCLAGAEDR